MDKLNESPLFDMVATQYVLGTLMHQPELLTVGDKYILTLDDFNNHKFYSIVFSAIYNSAYNGSSRITPTDIELYLTGYPTQHDIFVNDGGLQLVDLMFERTTEYDINNFEMCYNRVKKFTTLRELKSKGIDITEFYNPNYLNKEQEEQRFNKLSITDIIKTIRDKIQLVESHNLSQKTDNGQYASKGIRELVDGFRQSPEVGIPIEGTIFDYATRGCRKGKMLLYSAPSGGGKTRTMVGNACSIAFPQIVNGKIVRRETLEPVLFIATEMKADEIQTLILAWISGVNEEKILLGNTTPDEDKLINIAVNIMEKYEKNFTIETIPDPSLIGLKALITKYILQENIEYIFYDYIFTTPALMNEYKGVGLREDVVLMMLSNSLKEIAAEYNVFVMTGTQLNGSWEGKTVRNANMIRGSKAVADKVDIGAIGVRCGEDELKSIEEYCNSLNIEKPNIVIDIYKNRRGKLCDVKVFRKFDYGTCRVKDLFCTTQYYDPINDVITFERETLYEDLKDYE